MKRYFVYILASRYRGATYIGVTSDLNKRIAEHKTGKIQSYSSKWDIRQLVFYEEFQFIDHAIEREKELKKWRREWKWHLIEKDNPGWNDLANT